VIELHPTIRTPENIRAIHAAGKLASEKSIGGPPLAFPVQS